MVRASRLSVLKGEPGCLGMREGAATRQGTLSCLRRRAMHEAAGAGLVGDLQVGAGMSFADAAQALSPAA